MNKEIVILKYPVKRSVLAHYMGFSPRTLTRRLKELGINSKRTLTPIEMEKILKELGLPSWIKLEL